MSRRIAELLDALEEDPWRRDAGFSPEVQRAMVTIHDPLASQESVVRALNEWLSKYQPCLFGRVAAKQGSVCYCLLDDEVLRNSDEAVRDQIKEAQLAWRRAGWKGEASGFVIVLRSERLAAALPDESVKQIALRIASLYLETDVEPDRIYHDEIFFELAHGHRRSAWKWFTGVNYFSAQGDKRWWQDHRFPAGMAFSVNSVGHMVKSGKLTRALRDLEDLMEIPSDAFSNPKIDSLEKALEFAMRTIDMASEGPSGRATHLLPQRGDTGETPRCPVQLPEMLSNKNHCEYSGLYNTDYTVPGEYFTSSIERPAGLETHDLDFTYLFDEGLDNPDHSSMGQGQRIREPSVSGLERGGDVPGYRRLKRRRGKETEIRIDDIPGLRRTLGLN